MLKYPHIHTYLRPPSLSLLPSPSLVPSHSLPPTLQSTLHACLSQHLPFVVARAINKERELLVEVGVEVLVYNTCFASGVCCVEAHELVGGAGRHLHIDSVSCVYTYICICIYVQKRCMYMKRDLWNRTVVWKPANFRRRWAPPTYLCTHIYM